MFDLDLAGLEDLTVSRSSWGVLVARSSWGFMAGGSDGVALLVVVLVALLIAAAAFVAFRLATPAVAAVLTFIVAVLGCLLLL